MPVPTPAVRTPAPAPAPLVQSPTATTAIAKIAHNATDKSSSSFSLESLKSLAIVGGVYGALYLAHEAVTKTPAMIEREERARLKEATRQEAIAVAVDKEVEAEVMGTPTKKEKDNPFRRVTHTVTTVVEAESDQTSSKASRVFEESVAAAKAAEANQEDDDRDGDNDGED